MGNCSVKSEYERFPTCCKNSEEIPKTLPDFEYMLDYIRDCKLYYGKKKYFRDYSQFDFENITDALIEAKFPLDDFHRMLSWPIPWNVKKIYDCLNKKICRPSIAIREPRLAWDWTAITREFWTDYILQYDIPWDLAYVEKDVDLLWGKHKISVGKYNTESPIIFLFKVMIKYCHRPWKFRDQLLDEWVMENIIDKNSALYGYDWSRELLARCAKWKVDQTAYVSDLEPWYTNVELYKPTR